MNAQDRQAADALIRLAYKLLLDEIDMGDYVDILYRTLDRQEKPDPRYS